jgi:hypothetical protein
VSSDRFTSVPRDDATDRADDTAIIDVPEEPLLPPRQPAARERGQNVRGQYDVAQDARYQVSQEPPYMTPPPCPQPEPEPQLQDWQPVPAEGQWLPPGAPGSHWAGVDPTGATAGEPPGDRQARHYGAEETLDGSPFEHPQTPPYGESGRRARARHSAEYSDYGARDNAATNEPPPHSMPPPPAAAPHMAPPPPPEPAPRHRGADPLAQGVDGSADGPPSGGQSVADLLARLQVEPSGGGRRLRRESREG